RNEEVNLRTCLESLVAQEGITFELIVVDDNSTDRTREIAESFAKARVVDAGPLPPNWTGKNNAMTVGARQAKGKWLLFTDADAVGGHAAISSNLLEDVALARLVKTSGRRLRFRYGGDAVRTRMYRSFAQMKEGWTKNLALLFASTWSIACWRLSEFLVIFSLL